MRLRNLVPRDSILPATLPATDSPQECILMGVGDQKGIVTSSHLHSCLAPGQCGPPGIPNGQEGSPPICFRFFLQLLRWIIRWICFTTKGVHLLPISPRCLWALKFCPNQKLGATSCGCCTKEENNFVSKKKQHVAKHSHQKERRGLCFGGYLGSRDLLQMGWENEAPNPDPLLKLTCWKSWKKITFKFKIPIS